MSPRLALAGGTLALVAGAWYSPPDEAWPDSGSEGERPWSVQLHLHGPFSEGPGSVQSHLREAAGVGVDAVWWSEHDFRAASYRHASTFSFDGPAEPLGANEPWTALLEYEHTGTKKLRPPRSEKAGIHPAPVFTRERSRDGSPSLRVEIRGEGEGEGEGEDFRQTGPVLTADRGLFARPLTSGVTLHLFVLPLENGPDGRAFVECKLSEHGPKNRRHIVRYVLSNEGTEPTLGTSAVTIPVAYRAGEWNELVLPLTRDALEHLPFVGDDNSLSVLSVGAEARGGGYALAQFDDLRLEQDAAGEAAYARQRDLLRRVGRESGVRQYQGVEVSWLRALHLNEFSLDTGLLDYDPLLERARETAGGSAELAEGDLVELVARGAIDAAHDRGGLVSYNHMFGTAMAGGAVKRSRAQVLEGLGAARLFGADLLEVGYRDRGGADLADHLWIWDRLAERGLRPVGIGVSDAHGARSWRGNPNNFVSWILAPSLERKDLLAGLAAGRVFFGDIVHFDGRLDLRTARGFRMGQIVVTDRETAQVGISVEGVGRGGGVRLVGPQGPFAELAEVSETESSPAATVRLPTFVRAEVVDSEGEIQALSNPIHWVREVPAGGIAGGRAGVDFGGVRLGGHFGGGPGVVGDLTLLGVEAAEERGERVVRIACRAPEGASLRLAVEGPGGSDVELAGWAESSTESTGGGVHRVEVEGEGTLVVRRRVE